MYQIDYHNLVQWCKHNQGIWHKMVQGNGQKPKDHNTFSLVFISKKLHEILLNSSRLVAHYFPKVMLHICVLGIIDGWNIERFSKLILPTGTIISPGHV